MKLTPITLESAADFINRGLAGFYAWNCQAPIPHPTHMCVYADDRWWLTENGELKVVDKGIHILPGGQGAWTRAHTVEVDEDHPIAVMLLADRKADRGPDNPSPVSVILTPNEGSDRVIWSGRCRRCGIEWPPEPGHKFCMKCGAGPLDRFEDGPYILRMQVHGRYEETPAPEPAEPGGGPTP